MSLKSKRQFFVPKMCVLKIKHRNVTHKQTYFRLKYHRLKRFISIFFSPPCDTHITNYFGHFSHMITNGGSLLLVGFVVCFFFGQHYYLLIYLYPFNWNLKVIGNLCDDCVCMGIFVSVGCAYFAPFGAHTHTHTRKVRVFEWIYRVFVSVFFTII